MKKKKSIVEYMDIDVMVILETKKKQKERIMPK